ncbi:hypothetical protein TWF281_001483 [Arthrobotrys megalospora]
MAQTLFPQNDVDERVIWENRGQHLLLEQAADGQQAPDAPRTQDSVSDIPETDCHDSEDMGVVTDDEAHYRTVVGLEECMR